MKGDLVHNFSLGFHGFGGNVPKNGIKYHWTLLANELVQDVTEWNVRTDCEENWPKGAIFRAH